MGQGWGGVLVFKKVSQKLTKASLTSGLLHKKYDNSLALLVESEEKKKNHTISLMDA